MKWEIERAIEGEPGAAEAKKAVGESSESGGGTSTTTGRKSKYLKMVLEVSFEVRTNSHEGRPKVLFEEVKGIVWGEAAVLVLVVSIGS